MSILNWGWRKILLRAFAVIFIIYVALVIYRAFHFWNLEKTNKQVEKIHSTKLTLDDVFGKNLPLDPGAEADKTVAGIDANTNGIRDDVELAIFKEYPNSAKTRAVLLQYALALQMEVTQPMVNGGTAGEVANKEDRAIFCMAKIIPDGGEGSVFAATEEFGKFVTSRQFNTEKRKIAHKDFYSNLKSGRIDDSVSCDVELSSLI